MGHRLTWGEEEFLHTSIGDERRSARLSWITDDLLLRARGSASDSLLVDAKKQGATHLLASRYMCLEALQEASCVATARRASLYPRVLVAVDQTENVFEDPDDSRGLGATSRGGQIIRGLQVMNALALTPEGVPIGRGYQEYWCRPNPARLSKKEKRRLNCQKPFEEKEVFRYYQAVVNTHDMMLPDLGKCRPCYIIDRAGDFKEMHQWAEDNRGEADVILRATQDRCLVGEEKQRLFQKVYASPVVARYQISLPRRVERDRKTHRIKKIREARLADIELRFCKATITLQNYYNNQSLGTVTYTVIEAREISPVPKGDKPVLWRLLTTIPVESPEDASEVVFYYTLRWRIEEHHRTWKTLCHTEQQIARGFKRLALWSSILASVAMRIEQLKYAARKTPEKPAELFFSEAELRALKALSKINPNKDLNIGEALLALARLGGYSRNPKTRPYGATYIARGLERIAPIVALLLDFDIQRRVT